jgi:CRISPR system Cascade subunit CasD
MATLLLRLAGPLQSWGTASRFVRRNTDRSPSKSGVVGLLAAALGRQRTEPLDDLQALRVGVRVEQPGRIERDFQTARPRDGGAPMPLSYRFYLADAVFLVALEGNQELITSLHDAVRNPAFPLYLGRRSCPPAGPIALGLRAGSAFEVLQDEPWRASPWIQRRHPNAEVNLDAVIDSSPGEPGSDVVRDEPLSFDPRRRDYGWRSVRHTHITVPNPSHRGGQNIPTATETVAVSHDPFSAF